MERVGLFFLIMDGCHDYICLLQESAEAGKCFSLLEPTFQHQDGLPTGANGFPCSSGHLALYPCDLAANDIDAHPSGNDIEDASDVEATEGAEIDRSKCVSLPVTENLTMSLESPPRDMLNDAEPRNVIETHEKNASQNIAEVSEAANELPAELITSDDIKANVIKDESRPDSEQQLTPKRMPTTPSDSEEQNSLKRRRIAPPESL